jgi:hypothetical protein
VSTKLGLIFLAFLTWGTLCWKRYTCSVKGFCSDWNIWETPSAISYKPMELDYPVLFHWSKDNPIEGNSYDSLLRTAHEQISAGKKARIIGYFDKDEVNESRFDNLGIARAENFKSLLVNFIDSTQVSTDYKVFRLGEKNKDQTFKAITLEWLDPIEPLVKMKSGFSLCFEDKTNNALPLNSEMSGVVKELKNGLDENARVLLVGHTDDVGTQQYNIEVGLKKAHLLKDYLVKIGFDESRIEVVSKGASDPVASNFYANTRRKNNRIEIKLMY